MALLGGTATPQSAGASTATPSFSLACELYRNGAYAEAYVLFTPLAASDPAAMVNLALCHMRAEEWSAALNLLDKALELVKLPPRRNLPGDATYRALIQCQGSSPDYLCAMPRNAPQLVPDYTREVILRLLVDVCVECKLWERVQALAPGLAAKGYQNAVRALEKQKNQR